MIMVDLLTARQGMRYDSDALAAATAGPPDRPPLHVPSAPQVPIRVATARRSGRMPMCPPSRGRSGRTHRAARPTNVSRSLPSSLEIDALRGGYDYRADALCNAAAPQHVGGARDPKPAVRTGADDHLVDRYVRASATVRVLLAGADRRQSANLREIYRNVFSYSASLSAASVTDFDRVLPHIG